MKFDVSLMQEAEKQLRIFLAKLRQEGG